MAFSKYKVSLKKKLNSKLCTVVSSLRKENDYLKKILADHYKLVERFLSLEAERETFQHQTFKDKKTAVSSKQSSESEVKLMDKGTTSVELQNQLREALEKNKHWLERDQQREAYVREILDRMIWLEKQLNQANQAPSQQHKEDHSDEKTRKVEMQEHFERLLQKAKDELREEIHLTRQNLITIKISFEEMKIQVEEPKQGESEVQLKDLQCKLDEERPRSSDSEVLANMTLKYLLNQYHEDQEKIAEQQLSTQSLAASSDSVLLNESLLECPGCQAKYPASDYRELIKHIEICLD